MMQAPVSKFYHLQNGDIIFKDTEFSDRKKSLFMRTMNAITSGLQKLTRRIEKKERRKVWDHAEIFNWNKGIPETTSSVHKQGVRTMNQLNWFAREDFPYILILRRPTPMTGAEVEAMITMAIQDSGIPYNAYGAINSVLPTKRIKDSPAHNAHLFQRGVFCIEQVLRMIFYKKWQNQSPDELMDILLDMGYFPVFEGDSSELVD